MLVSAWREAGDIFTARRRPPCTGPRPSPGLGEPWPDEAFAAVSAQFQPKEVSDLTLGIGVINVYNRLSIGFRRPPDGSSGA